jgi:hypothetical protein
MFKKIDYAIQAVDKGYHVTPACRPKITSRECHDHKDCKNPGKVPIHPHYAVTNSADQVKRLWVKDYNILCKTQESNIVVLDYDPKPDKPEGTAWINRALKEGRLNTRSHRSGSGGVHYIYRSVPGLAHGDRICRGLDLRGMCHHHLLIWVGSQHENGRFYEVIDDTEPEEIPQWLIDEITRTKAKFNPAIYTAPSETILEQLWNEAGLQIIESDIRNPTVKHWIPCLLEGYHSSGRNRFDCVLMSGAGIGRWGSYVCQHQSHKKITTQQAVNILRKQVSPEAYDRIVGRYQTKSAKQPYNIRTVEDCSKAIESMFNGIDEKRGKIIIAKVTTGTGKTEEAIKYLGNHGHLPTSYFVPNHNLATEFGERLVARTGIEAAHPMGITAFKNEHSCVFPGMVLEAARLKLPIRQNVCVTCPHFNNYRNTGEKCKAGNASTSMQGKHKILQHSSLDAVLRDAAISGGNKLLIVDEQPELVTSQELHLSLFNNDEAFDLYGVDQTDTARYRQLANLIVKASKIFKGFATAKDVVSVGKNGANLVFDFNDESAKLLETIAEKELGYPYETAARIAKRITAGYSDAPKRLKLLADVFTLLYGLRTACVYPNRETFHFKDGKVTLRVPATWIVEATKYCAQGGNVLVMSASANIDVLKETLGDISEFVIIHAADAEGITRSYRYDNRVSRKVLCPNKTINEGAIRGALSRVYEDLADYGNVTQALLITHKPVAEAIRGEPERFLPIPWQRQIEAGGELHIAHYGAIVGLDAYKHVDAVITMGDAIPNIDVVIAESRALGVREDSYMKSKIQGEALQAQGRIRACRRTAPALVLHAGLHKPDVQLDPNWLKWILPDVY